MSVCCTSGATAPVTTTHASGAATASDRRLRESGWVCAPADAYTVWLRIGRGPVVSHDPQQ